MIVGTGADHDIPGELGGWGICVGSLRPTEKRLCIDEMK